MYFYPFTDKVHTTQQGRVEMDNPTGQTQQLKGKDNVHISSPVVYRVNIWTMESLLTDIIVEYYIHNHDSLTMSQFSHGIITTI